LSAAADVSPAAASPFSITQIPPAGAYVSWMCTRRALKPDGTTDQAMSVWDHAGSGLSSVRMSAQ